MPDHLPTIKTLSYGCGRKDKIEDLAPSHLSVPSGGTFPPTNGCREESNPQGQSMQSVSGIINPKTDFKSPLNPDTVCYFDVIDSRSLRTESQKLKKHPL